MFSKSKLKDYIGILYYRHGLFCASNPVKCLLSVFLVLFLCCYPLTKISSFSSSLEQYKQSINTFDGLEANSEINEFVQYERMADRPAWYNRVPVAYIQRIVVKSILTIPSSDSSINMANNNNNNNNSKIRNKILFNETNNDSKNFKIYLVDALRAPLSQLFDLNEFLHNFRTENKLHNTVNKDKESSKSLISDLCVHVGELKEFLTFDQSTQHKSSSDSSSSAASSGSSSSSSSNSRQNNVKHKLPEFNCLYLSPTNFWSNDLSLFNQDDDIIRTINESPNNFKNIKLNKKSDSNSNSGSDSDTNDDTKHHKTSLFIYLYDLIKNLSNRIKFTSRTLLDPNQSARLSELLFGVSSSSMITSLKDNVRLMKRLEKLNFNLADTNKSIVFTYSITIALKRYDKPFIDELKEKLEKKFSIQLDTTSDPSSSSSWSDSDETENTIVNLQYTSQSFVYYIPYAVLYFLLFLYIYMSVRKIEFVKSKWGLAFAAVTQVIASLFMSIGICSFFGLTPTLNGGEIFPYLIIFIGFENIVVLTKSVVSTPFDLDVRYRIALGLKKESWLITKILTFELIIIFCGILTMVPAIQEFCVFAYVGLLIDFFMQMIFFVTVLSIDIRRMELSDLNKQLNMNLSSTTTTTTTTTNHKSMTKIKNNENELKTSSSPSSLQQQLNSSSSSSSIFGNESSSLFNSSQQKLIYRGGTSLTITNNDMKNLQLMNHNNHSRNNSNNDDDNGTIENYNSSRQHQHQHIRRTNKISTSYSNLVTNKSVQFFYFWARTRLVQRAVMILSVLWIILIFYKSLIVVELMRHDVNVSKETVEALLPKGVGLSKLIKDNFQQFLFTTTSSSSSSSFTSSSSSPDQNNLNGAVSSLPSSSISSQFIPDSDKRLEPVSPLPPDSNTFISNLVSSSTIDYLKRNIQNLIVMSQLNSKTNNLNSRRNQHNSGVGSKWSSTDSASFSPDTNLFDSSTVSTKSNMESFDSSKHSQTLADCNWKTLNYYHWLTLFANYNVSLYNRYVAILPQINLYRTIKQSDILKTRNLNEIKKYNSILVADGEEIFASHHNQNQNNANYNNRNNFESRFNKQPNDDRDDRDDDDDDDDDDGSSSSSDNLKTDRSLFKWALFELIGIVVLGIPTIYLCVYLFTLFYKCLCSKKYEQWRKSWSTANIKRQYKILHSHLNCSRKNSTNSKRKDGNFDELDCSCDSSSSSSIEEDSFSSSDSSGEAGGVGRDSDEFETINKQKIKRKINSSNENYGFELSKNDSNKSSAKSSSKLNDYAMINRIINGQKDDIELMPFKVINCDSNHPEKCSPNPQKHCYPIDLITCGSYKCATSDINNQILIWSLNSFNAANPNDLIQTIDLNSINKTINDSSSSSSSFNEKNSMVSIWSMRLSDDDRCLFVGQSDGQLKVFDLTNDQTAVPVYKVYDYNYKNGSSSASSSSSSHADMLSTNGITHLIQIKSKFNLNQEKFFIDNSTLNQKSILLKHIDSMPESLLVTSSSFSTKIPTQASTPSSASAASTSISLNSNMQQKQLDQFVYFILIARLTGILELIRFVDVKPSTLPSLLSSSNGFKNQTQDSIKLSDLACSSLLSSFSLLQSNRIHNSPITNIFYANGGDYLLTTSQDCLLNVIKLSLSAESVTVAAGSNYDKRTSYQRPNEVMSVNTVTNEHGDSPITAMCIDSENTLNAATGSLDGLICLWNLFTGQCEFKLKNNLVKQKSTMNGRRNDRSATLRNRRANATHRGSTIKSEAILKLEIAQNLVISLNADHQMCIWHRTKGELIKEFKFFAPALQKQLRTGIESGELNVTSDSCLNSYASTIMNSIGSSLLRLYRYYLKNSSDHIDSSKEITTDDLLFLPPPTMCLYSKSILITGGCSCIFIWDVVKGELVKKINIKKPVNQQISTLKNGNRFKLNILAKYTQKNLIKQIKLIRQTPIEILNRKNLLTLNQIEYLKSNNNNISSGSSGNSSSTNSNFTKNNSNKLLLITDYNDSIYILKIPSNLTQISAD